MPLELMVKYLTAAVGSSDARAVFTILEQSPTIQVPNRDVEISPPREISKLRGINHPSIMLRILLLAPGSNPDRN
jgi:hypothetical protein